MYQKETPKESVNSWTARNTTKTRKEKKKKEKGNKKGRDKVFIPEMNPEPSRTLIFLQKMNLIIHVLILFPFRAHQLQHLHITC